MTEEVERHTTAGPAPEHRFDWQSNVETGLHVAEVLAGGYAAGKAGEVVDKTGDAIAKVVNVFKGEQEPPSKRPDES